MKIIFFEAEFDYILEEGRTSIINIFKLQGENYCTSLFECGQYQGNVIIEILFHRFIFWKIIDLIDKRFDNNPTIIIMRLLRNFLRKFV